MIDFIKAAFTLMAILGGLEIASFSIGWGFTIGRHIADAGWALLK